jgi:hypothetical protein
MLDGKGIQREQALIPLVGMVRDDETMDNA